MTEARPSRAVPPSGPARAVWDVAAQVADPEIPVLTLEDMGILRTAELREDGVAVVQITPTYCGCPAMDAMAQDIEAALAAAGFRRAEVRLVWSPAWTTDWMTDRGRTRLEEFGIAPPRETPRTGSGLSRYLGWPSSETPRTGSGLSRYLGWPSSETPRTGSGLSRAASPPRPPRCPQCHSQDTELVSQFGSTACKALCRCTACGEPFDHFKELT